MTDLHNLQLKLSKSVYEQGFEDFRKAMVSEMLLLIEDGLEYETPLSEIIKHVEEIKPNFEGRYDGQNSKVK